MYKRQVYAVCTLTRSETTGVADSFQEGHSNFEPAPIPVSAGGAARLHLLPQEVDGNGMFVAAWRRVR